MEIKIPYYKDMSRLSNSNIGWLLKKGPRYLKDMLDGKIEGLKLPQLEKGTMIHEYILQPENFWDDYLVLDVDQPKSKQQKLFLDEYHKARLLNPLDPIEKLKLDAYKTAYTNNKTDEASLKEADGMIVQYQDYLEYLRKKEDKKIISFADLALLKKIKTNLIEHKKAKELLYEYPDTFEVHNEFHVNWTYKDPQVPCKSLIDRLMIDHTNHKIILIDLKTTGDVYDFKHSVDEFDYRRQLAFYLQAIEWYFVNELHIDPVEYQKEIYIIAIESHDNCEIRVFKFHNIWVLDRNETIDKAVKEYDWHCKNNLWDHTRDYYEGDGEEWL